MFVQQTLLMAANDEDLAFKQKQKDWALYTKKVWRCGIFACDTEINCYRIYPNMHV